MSTDKGVLVLDYNLKTIKSYTMPAETVGPWLVYSPDGGMLYVAGERFASLKLADGTLTTGSQAYRDYGPAQWLPDSVGKEFLGAQGTAVAIFNLQGTMERRLNTDRDGQFWGASRDGSQVLMRDGVFHAASNQMSVFAGPGVMAAAINPAGTEVALGYDFQNQGIAVSFANPQAVVSGFGLIFSAASQLSMHDAIANLAACVMIVTYLQYSPDGSLLSVLSGDGWVRLLKRDQNEIKPEAPTYQRDFLATAQLGSQTWALQLGGRLGLISQGKFDAKYTLPDQVAAMALCRVPWSTASVFVGDSRGMLQLIDTTQGKSTRFFSTNGIPIIDLAAGNNDIALAQENSSVVLINANAIILHTFSLPAWQVPWHVAVSSDDLIACADSSGIVYVWDKTGRSLGVQNAQMDVYQLWWVDTQLWVANGQGDVLRVWPVELR